jgi:hypothetical protein
MRPLWALAVFAIAAAPVLQSQTEVTDPALSKGIALVRDGEYDAGLAAIDAALQDLETSRSLERALGHLHAGVALVAKGQTVAAKTRFRKALEENPGLRVGPDQFSPKVTEVFSAAKAEQIRAPATNSPLAPPKPEPSELRLVRSTSGSRGTSRAGRFQVDDPRSAFRVPDDKQLVVYFEWTGPPGTYLLEGAWKDPTGAVTLQPQVEAKGARGHVGSYWFLSLPATMTPGQWTLEITLEGRLVGQHSVQIAGQTASAEPLRPPDATDVYAKIASSVLVIEKRDKGGMRFGRGLGFFVKENLLATAFQVVEGASSLRVVLPDERSFVVEEVAGWNRWQDWALVELPAGPHPALPFGPPTSSEVWAMLLSIDRDGTISPTACWLSPASPHPKGGDRLTLAWLREAEKPSKPVRVDTVWVSQEAMGGPVVNGRGEVIGILGGNLIPGETIGERLGLLSSILVTPANLITMPPINPTPLRALIASGASLEPPGTSELGRATFARGSELRREGLRGPVNESAEFTRGDANVILWAIWHPRKNRKTRLGMRLLDLDGRLLAEDKPVLTRFQRDTPTSSTWTLSVANLHTGIYRADILEEGAVVWRGFFRLSP